MSPRALVLNDLHYTRSEPTARGPDYAKAILEKLHEARFLALKVRASAILCTGDWFDRKGKVTYQETCDMLAILLQWREAGLQVAGILGNHDVAGHSLESLDTRAVGVLVRSGALQLLDQHPLTIEDDRGSLYVTGTSYFHGCDRDDRARAEMYGAPPGPDPAAFHLHLAHGALVLRGEFFEDFTRAEDLPSLLVAADRCPDLVVSGHLHYPEAARSFQRPVPTGEEPPDPPRRVVFARNGSVARVSRDDLTRIPTALLVATAGRDVVLREVEIGRPVTPIELAPVEDRRDRDEAQARLTQFVQVLREQAEIETLEDPTRAVEAAAVQLNAAPRELHAALEAVRERIQTTR